MRNRIEKRFVDVFTAYDGSKVRLPLMIKKSPNHGPTIFLVGVVHGEEVIGIEVIHRIFKNTKLKSGTIYAIPVANMAGFSLGVRTVPFGEQADWSDLNRIFPGDPDGKPGEKIADVIYKVILKAKPNLVIDVHADSQNSLPFILLDRLVEQDDDGLISKTRELAEAFGITVCNDSDISEYIKDSRDKSLTGALLNYGRIPAFVVELGGPNVIKELFVRVGVEGLKNVLLTMGMINDWAYRRTESKILTDQRLYTIAVFAKKHSGKIVYKINLGEKIKKNQLIALIEDVFGKEQEKVFAPADGWIISLGYQALSFPGIPIATLAIKDAKN